MIVLKGKNKESISINVEPDIEGFMLDVAVACPTQRPEMSLMLKTNTYQRPKLDELNRLVSGDENATFEFRALRMMLRLSSARHGVREGLIAQVWISTVKELDYFPWPNVIETFLLGDEESVGLHQLAFICDRDDVQQFATAMECYFDGQTQ